MINANNTINQFSHYDHLIINDNTQKTTDNLVQIQKHPLKMVKYVGKSSDESSEGSQDDVNKRTKGIRDKSISSNSKTVERKRKSNSENNTNNAKKQKTTRSERNTERALSVEKKTHKVIKWSSKELNTLDYLIVEFPDLLNLRCIEILNRIWKVLHSENPSEYADRSEFQNSIRSQANKRKKLYERGKTPVDVELSDEVKELAARSSKVASTAINKDTPKHKSENDNINSETELDFIDEEEDEIPVDDRNKGLDTNNFENESEISMINQVSEQANNSAITTTSLVLTKNPQHLPQENSENTAEDESSHLIEQLVIRFNQVSETKKNNDKKLEEINRKISEIEQSNAKDRDLINKLKIEEIEALAEVEKLKNEHQQLTDQNNNLDKESLEIVEKEKQLNNKKLQLLDNLDKLEEDKKNLELTAKKVEESRSELIVIDNDIKNSSENITQLENTNSQLQSKINQIMSSLQSLLNDCSN